MNLLPMPPKGMNLDQGMIITKINDLVVKLAALQDRQVILHNYLLAHGVDIDPPNAKLTRADGKCLLFG